MKAATCSCLTDMYRRSLRSAMASIRCMIVVPGSPKTYSTPSRRRASTAIRAPFTDSAFLAEATSDHVALPGLGGEQLRRGEHPAGESLVEGVPQEYPERGLVAGQTVAPEVWSHQLLGALGLRVQPRQHVPARRRLGHPPQSGLPGLLERLVQRLCEPRACLVHVAPEHDHVHDREDPGRRVVLLLVRPGVGE